MDGFVDWVDNMGVLHHVREKGCVMCKHCTDIFLDPFKNNQIYACLCELGEHPKIDCELFESDKE